MTEAYDGLTQLGQPRPHSGEPRRGEAGARAEPAPGRAISGALHLPGVHLALSADRPAGFRAYRHRLRAARVDRREQVAEAVPHSFRNHGAFHEACTMDDRADGWWSCSTRCGCASAATGIRAAACRSTCSGRPARRRRACGSRIRACAVSRPRLRSAAAQIRAQALALGFDAVGFAPANLAPEARDRLRDSSPPASTATWAGWPTAREQRSHPQALWPEARSVICLGLSYAPEDDPLATLRAAGPRQHLRLCAQPRLPRRAQGHAEAPGAVHRLALRRGGKGVRRYRAGDGKAAGGAGRARLAGQAHQSGLARARLLAVPGRDLHHAGAAARRAARRPLRHLHALPAMSARPMHSRRRTGSMRRAASPT